MGKLFLTLAIIAAILGFWNLIIGRYGMALIGGALVLINIGAAKTWWIKESS